MDVERIVERIYNAVSRYIEKHARDLESKLEQRIAALPKPEPGAKGEPGERGEPGPKGDDGKSVTLEEIHAIALLDLKEMVAQLPPPKNGVDGKSVSVDDVLPALLKAIPAPIPGEPGPKGEPGINGKDGTNGRDAADIDVLDEINPAKSYPAGMWAKFQGGLIRSKTQTTPIIDGDLVASGWQVVVAGIDKLQVAFDEFGRSLKMQVTMTGGAVTECETKLATMIYRGVFREGKDYERGDMATWNGSLWHAQKSTTAVPGTSGDWLLAAKRGQDGKPGIGTKGDKGDPGRPGRDLTQMAPTGEKY